MPDGRPPDGLLRGVARRHRRELVVIGVLAVCEALLVLAQPWPLKFAVDNAIGGRPFPRWLSSFDALGTAGRTAFAIGFSIVIVGLASALSYLLTLRATRTSEAIGAELRTTVLRRLLVLDASFHERHHSGDLANRVTSDVSRVERAVVSISTTVVPEMLTLVGIVLIMARLDLLLAGGALLVVPALWAVTVRRRSAVRSAEQAARTEAGRLAAESVDAIRRFDLIQTFGRETLALRRYGHRNRRVLEREVEAARVEARYRPIADLLVALVGGLCLAFGVAQVSRGTMTVGVLLVLLAYMSRIFGPVRALSSLATSLAKASASRDRLLEVLHASPAVAEPEPSIGAPRHVADVVFTDVTFAYRHDEPVLRGVTLTIPAGAFVTVVGRSGAGKSTLLQLLRRSYDPSSGAIALDGTALDRYSLASLRDRIAYVPQDAPLIEGTIAENIAFGRSGAALHEVRRAARRATADEFIVELPHGYHTRLGEGGVGLSGGQRRRVALARAVLRNAPLVLLDEPTSGLDATSEEAVLRALQNIAGGRTVVVVSHHLGLAACADLVVVLDDGLVAEVGPPAALIASDGPFSELWASAHGFASQHQQTGEHDHEQCQGMLGPVRRQRRVGQVRQVEQVEQVEEVQEVQEVGQVGLLSSAERGSRGAAASPSPTLDAVRP